MSNVVSGLPSLCHRRSPSRRGAAAVAMVMVMVMVGLIIVGLTLRSARNQEIAIVRLDALRAFYAAEAGANMAIRERLSNTDFDGDGVIGTISNDGNAGNDPSVTSGQVYVTSATVSGNVVLTSIGRSGSARRKISITTKVPQNTRIVYDDEPSATPATQTWNGTTWSGASGTLNIGKKPRWCFLRRNPTRDELIGAFIDDDKDVNVMVYNGSAWGNLVEVSTDCGTNTERPLAVAYSQASGTGLVAYRVNAQKKRVYYRTWDGSSWSAAASTADLAVDEMKWMRLAGIPGSDKLVCVTSSKGKDINALVWNGSSFGSATTLETDIPYENEQCWDAVAERVSGRCMVVWAKNGSNQPRYSIWNGSAWSAAATLPDIGSKARWIKLAADTVSNKIIMIAVTDVKNIECVVWNGSSWGARNTFETSVPGTDRRYADVCFEAQGTNAMAMYSEDGVHTPRYRIFDGSSWSAELTAPTLSAKKVGWVQLIPTSGREIIAGILRKDDTALYTMRWEGSTWGDLTLMDSDAAVLATEEDFMIAPPGRPMISSWAEAQPW